MRVRYWTIALSPHPTCINRFGIGVVAEDTATNTFDFRIINVQQLSRQSYISGDYRTTQAMLRILRDTLDALPRGVNNTVENNRPQDFSSTISLLTNHWNNAISVEPARLMSAQNSLHEATQHLFETFVLPRSPQRQQGLTRLRGRLRAAYGAHEEITRNLLVKPTTYFGPLNTPTDFAIVKDGAAYELSTAFNFAGSDHRRLLERAHAWSFHVQNLREKGGTLIQDGGAVEISAQAPTVAVISPPQDSAQQEVHHQATILWEELGIQEISESSIEAHVNALAHKLAS
ncbi:hypothetical protein P4N68_08935 [Corynebacterium felinum]|uniref:DUF3037 domain-containing protein n=1 Tax=Corynebacterium felinum TaxID=131318 RepID=A0ABU2BCF9_9CORY|nr:hypothetical protein [Corynebacterium felinum]MDF5821199.1 hypothetical protein [Corynebacterium felinum]MDR7356283.1 hypothetical protein [Corynebacterium felinum]WJY95616.1 hypothetical protein CFELI_10080 [Corynebacterium felinum]